MSNIFKLVTHIGDKDIRKKEPDNDNSGYSKKAVEYRKKMMAQKLSPSGKVVLKKSRLLTDAERAEKTKDWPKAVKEPNDAEI